MRAGMMLAAGDGFDVNAVRCADACRGFDTAEETTGHALVFVRRGAFIRRTAGREVLLDSTVAYLAVPGGADIDGELAEQVVGTVAALVARGRADGTGGG